MPRARYAFDIFLRKSPSLSRDCTSHQEGQREECETEIQFIIGKLVLYTEEGAGIFINPLVTMGDQGENREVDLETPPRNMVEEEEQLEQLEN